MMKRAAVIMICLFFLLGGVLTLNTQPVSAQQPGQPQQPQQPQPTPSDDAVNRVASTMYCPVCENIPLDVCPTQACHDWRELIRQKLAAGWSDQQIRDYFAVQYGDRVLNEPPARGLNWLVYVIPPLAFLVGVVIVWRVLVGMRRNAASGSTGSTPVMPPPADDPYLAKLEEELKKKA